MTSNEQLKLFTDRLTANLCRIEVRPANWLPHTVYVEEESESDGGYPFYRRYTLDDFRPDGTCTLRNPGTNTKRDDYNLSAINIEWLDYLWSRYKSLCADQGIYGSVSPLKAKKPLTGCLKQ